MATDPTGLDLDDPRAVARAMSGLRRSVRRQACGMDDAEEALDAALLKILARDPAFYRLEVQRQVQPLAAYFVEIPAAAPAVCRARLAELLASLTAYVTESCALDDPLPPAAAGAEEE